MTADSTFAVFFILSKEKQSIPQVYGNKNATILGRHLHCNKGQGFT